MTAGSSRSTRGSSRSTLGLRRIEVLLADEKTRREILERSLQALKGEVVALQARIADVERRLGAP